MNFKAKFIKVVTGSLLILFVIVLGFMFYKEQTFTVFKNSEANIYEGFNINNDKVTLFMLPKNELVVRVERDSLFQFALYSLKGTSLTHYMGPIYNTGSTLLSLKYYDDAIDAWRIEASLSKVGGNSKGYEFGQVGQKSEYILIEKENSLELADIVYQRKTKEDFKDLLFLTEVFN